MTERAICGALIAIAIALALGTLVLFTVVLVEAGLSWFIITFALVAAVGAGVGVLVDGLSPIDDIDD